MFFDILEFEDIEDGTVRLSASTLNQLFEDTKYDLNEIRKSKMVGMWESKHVGSNKVTKVGKQHKV